MSLRPVDFTFLDDEYNQPFGQSDVIVVGAAYDATASYGKGARFGPDAILDASHQMEYEVTGTATPLTEKVRICTKGVLEFDNKVPMSKYDASAKEMVANVEAQASLVFKAKKLLLLLGGEHSVSIGAFQAIAKLHAPKDVTIVHFDAHLDQRDEFDGTKFSHACALRRAHDLGFKILSIGPRDRISADEKALVESKKFAWSPLYCATQPKAFYKGTRNLIFDGKVTEDQLKDVLSKITTKYVYITIDVDCLDSSIMPGTGTPLPKGLTFEGLEDILFAIVSRTKEINSKILGIDVVELSPQLKRNVKSYNSKDCISTISEMNAAIIVYDILSWIFMDRFNNL